MKVLVREYKTGVCNYVWKKVSYNDPFRYSDYYTEDGACYEPIQILKITHDYRTTGYVMCCNCGKVVKQTKITKHYEEQERKVNCMKCNKLKLEEIKGTRVNTLKQDGNVLSRIMFEAKCVNSPIDRYWSRYKKIKDVNKSETCKYFACRRSDTTELRRDFFCSYPNPFNNFLTENGIINNGWKYISSSNSGREYSNKNGKLIARFDMNGILIHFCMMHRNNTYHFVYSDVYDKFMDSEGNEFRWGNIAETTKNNYIKQIRALYK